MPVTKTEYDELVMLDSLGRSWHTEPCDCGTFDCIGWVLVAENKCLPKFHLPLVTTPQMESRFNELRDRVMDERARTAYEL